MMSCLKYFAKPVYGCRVQSDKHWLWSGGLIIGESAIRAGLTSPAMLVIAGSTAVATFNLVNQSLTGIVSVLRIVVLLVSAFFECLVS
ncbi:hypothetical protein skT53_34740 [Effusibacillus dendaii]|uniref:Uncharacterized protein n=1 Tax=Effusibacillus dendaii TaxID=2743772 RepID=A0A7I8DHK1_9BACL|nr:hypothetical protein skT53_34740 [Effusibacillus dendaii]